jgi:tRNA pseudouridine38-40 synthase
MINRYKIIIEYDGTNYSGWSGSIDKAIEKAIFNLSKKYVKIFGAGRTDAGVHAIGQVAHFDFDKEISTSKIITGINYFLKINNERITIIDCENVDINFHSRFDAKKRHYKYRILNRPQPTIIDKYRVWHIHKKLNLDKMQQCLPFLIGKKDWSSFRASNCQAKSPIKTIDKVNLYKENDEIIFEIEAKSFLYHQVRNIVGTLVDIGLERFDNFEYIVDIKDRTKAGKTAPAHALYFMKVEY